MILNIIALIGLIIVGAVTYKFRYKLPFLVAAISIPLPLFVESSGIFLGRWKYAHGTLFTVLGVPIELIAVYVIAIYSAALAVLIFEKRFTKEKINRFLPYLVLVMITGSIFYFYFTMLIVPLIISVATYLYTMYNKSPVILISSVAVFLDILVENIIVKYGVITYTQGYGQGIYMSMFVWTFFFTSLTLYLNKKFKFN